MAPFRLDPYVYPGRGKIQFTTSAEMPNLIYQACLKTGVLSNTVYCQHALIDALVRDLGLDRDLLISHLPRPRGPAKHLYPHPSRSVEYDQTGGVLFTGPANTYENID